MDPVTIVKAAQIAATVAKSRTLRTVIAGSVVMSAVMVAGVMLAPSDLIAVMAGRHARQAFVNVGDGSCPAPLGGQTDANQTSMNQTGVNMSGYTQAQIGNARTIWVVSRQEGLPGRAAVIAIAAAMQESALRNLDHGDRDSLGLFQQRAGWGPRAVRMDPAGSSRLFYRALTGIDGWQQLPVTVAAQRVQRSAYPQAYARHERAAQALVNLFTTTAESGRHGLNARAVVAGAMCSPDGGGALSCPATGWGIEHGLTPDALRVLRCVHQRWPQIRDFAGVGDRPANVDQDHQNGRAVDIMIPNPRSTAGQRLGAQIAAWVQHNAARLGVTYIIWHARIWSVARVQEGWRACGTPAASCYAGPDDTAAHRDHVHVSVHGNTAGTRSHDDTATGRANTRNGDIGSSRAAGAVVLPVSGYTLTARFGACSSHWAACHTGLDFAVPSGRTIHAVTAGTVTYAGWGGPYGRLTKIKINDRIEVWYAHQSAQAVQVGQHITTGQAIGRVGATGNVTGPHLHLEIRIGGTPVDPEPWLTAHGAPP